MRDIRLISSKQILGELNVDYNIYDEGLLSQVPRHIARALEIMELDGYFQLTYSKHSVEEFRVPLPCDAKYILGAFISDGNCVTRIPLKGTMSDNNSFFGISLNQNKSRLDGNYLISQEETGTVAFVYYSIPVDEEGMPLIPDNPHVLEALPEYIIARLSLSGYKHPVISFEMAEARWRDKYPRASNSVNYPSIEEMAKFTLSNTNPYFDRLLYLDNNYSTDAVPVFLSKDLLAKEEPIPTIVQEVTNVVQITEATLGWVIFENPVYTSTTPFIGGGSEFIIPIGSTLISFSDAPDLLLTAIDRVTHSIKIANLQSSYIGRLDFKLKNSLTNRKGDIYFDIGSATPIVFSNSNFDGNSNAGEAQSVSVSLPLHQLSTLNVDTVKLKAVIDGDFEIYDIILYLNQIDNGTN